MADHFYGITVPGGDADAITNEIGGAMKRMALTAPINSGLV